MEFNIYYREYDSADVHDGDIDIPMSGPVAIKCSPTYSAIYDALADYVVMCVDDGPMECSSSTGPSTHTWLTLTGITLYTSDKEYFDINIFASPLVQARILKVWNGK